MPSQTICGAARTISWPICDIYCPVTRKPGDPPDRHVCGKYRGDTIARWADG